VSTLGPNWSDIAQTVFIGLQVLVLIAAAIYARSQLREAKELREEAKELREQQIRPFVVIDLDSTRKPFFDLVVKNIGTSMAREVSFEFEPEAKSTMEHADLGKLKMFTEGIATLPPGKEIRTLFDTGPARFSSELPDTYAVTVRYCDQTGKRNFEESMDLDFGLYWNRLSVTLYDIHDVHKQLSAIAGELAKWTATPGGGILEVTPKDMRDRQAATEKQLEEYRAEQESEGSGEERAEE
jgi:hypothetical protein